MTNCSTICFRKRSCDTLKKLRTRLGKKRLSNIIVNHNRTRMKLCQIDNPESIEWPHRNAALETIGSSSLGRSPTKGSVRLRQPAIFRLVPDCPRPDKFLLRTRRHRDHWEQCPIPYRTFLARPGTAEASRKSLLPWLASECCADRAPEFAPSRQRFHPSALVVGRLGREQQGHRCCLAKAPGPGRRSLWHPRNPAAPSIDNKPARAESRASSAGVFARWLRPAPLRHGERRSYPDRRNTPERSHERVWPRPAQKLGRAAPHVRKNRRPSQDRLERTRALQEPIPGGTRRKPLNWLSV